jgi:uncharacterized protein (TIGR02452 family)
MPNQLVILPCLDSDSKAAMRHRELSIDRTLASALGRSAVQLARAGIYQNSRGQAVSIAADVAAACANKLSISPYDPLPTSEWTHFSETTIQVANETTLAAARRLADKGLRPLALNFANGVSPGGGFLNGARAQEETLCRSSALYLTLDGDPMYAAHAKNEHRDSSDWAILSPDVPVFRADDGLSLERPWLLSFITCAAPHCNFPPGFIRNLVASDTADLTYTGLVLLYADQAAKLLRQRIHRVLAIAKAYQYDTLVLGAWGCGAFNNDPKRAAANFREALDTDFRGAFSNIVFAITDWSPERKFLAPFRDAFAE